MPTIEYTLKFKAAVPGEGASKRKTEKVVREFADIIADSLDTHPATVKLDDVHISSNGPARSTGLREFTMRTKLAVGGSDAEMQQAAVELAQRIKQFEEVSGKVNVSMKLIAANLSV